MKVKLDRGQINDANKVRIETENFIFDLSICKVTGKLTINKVDGIDSGSIAIYSRYGNEIELT